MKWRSGLLVLFYGLSVCILGCDDNGINHKDRPVDTTHFYHLWYALEHPDRAITLEIDGDTATELPDQLLQLPKLQFLFWNEGRLAGISSIVGDMQYLEYLSFLNNHIESVAPDIGRLKNLRVLDIATNKLMKIPNEVCNLESLSRLELQNNRISVLSDSIHKLRNLKDIRIRNNPISKQEIERIKRALPNLLYFDHD